MSIIGNEALAGASGQAGYFIDRSLRFRSSAGAYLSRTPSVNGNRQTFTFSCWIKRGSDIGSGARRIFESHIGGSDDFIRWNNDNIMMYFTSGAMNVQTTAVYRDPSAWYHIVWRVDTTQATASDRNRLYVNGVQVTTFSTATYPSQNYSTGSLQVAGKQHNIGSYGGSTEAIDGYLTEVNFIDGQSLDASYFGETDTDTGVWKPIEYIGSYGTNGFYLNFKNPATTVTLCADQSGNGNNWGANNISLSAGSTYDSMQDVPTLTDADAGNYATLNPLSASAGGLTFSNGNLTVTPTVFRKNCKASITLPNTGKYYWEWTFNSTTGASAIYNPSIAPITSTADSSLEGAGLYAFWVYTSSSLYVKYNNTLVRPTQAVTWSTSDVMQFAVDMDTRRVWLGKNNAWFDTSTGTTGNPSAGTNYLATLSSDYDYAPSVAGETTGITSNVNFGQRPFAYTPPTGFKKLNTFNLPDSTIEDGSDYFNTVLYSGANPNAAQSITGVGFQPDFLWIKSRVTGYGHALQDVLRGATGRLQSDTTGTESVSSTYVSSFDSDGFSLGVDYGQNAPNEPYVAWQWKANGSGVSNTDGSITSTVSANTTSGFSIVTYTGDGSNANRTVGHGLGVAPEFIIVKTRSEAARNWLIWHKDLTNYDYALLFTTDAQAANRFGPSAPTSSVFGVYGGQGNRGTETFVSYAFASIEGYSAFGSYTGNGSADGPFVYTGFRPKYLLIKSSSASATNWVLQDSVRFTYNVIDDGLLANTSAAEYSSGYDVDIVSNGFKIRRAGGDTNASSATYIYAAFAENPFKNSLAR